MFRLVDYIGEMVVSSSLDNIVSILRAFGSMAVNVFDATHVTDGDRVRPCADDRYTLRMLLIKCLRTGFGM
jgi:hypothetical protein